MKYLVGDQGTALNWLMVKKSIMQKSDIKTKKDGKSIAVQRSEIHPDYANRFIREFLL